MIWTDVCNLLHMHPSKKKKKGLDRKRDAETKTCNKQKLQNPGSGYNSFNFSVSLKILIVKGSKSIILISVQSTRESKLPD